MELTQRWTSELFCRLCCYGVCVYFGEHGCTFLSGICVEGKEHTPGLTLTVV